MISLRNGFTFVANFTVLSAALIIFSVVLKKPDEEFRHAQVRQFRILDIMIIAFGVFSSTFYMIFIREVPLSKQAREMDSEYKKA